MLLRVQHNEGIYQESLAHSANRLRMELTLIHTNSHSEIKYLVSPEIGAYSNENSYFLPNIIRRYLTYVYDSTCFIGIFSITGTIKN